MPVRSGQAIVFEASAKTAGDRPRSVSKQIGRHLRRIETFGPDFSGDQAVEVIVRNLTGDGWDA